MAWLDGLPIEDRVDALRTLYRKVFTSVDGRLVFAAMLEDLKYFDPGADGDMALQNYAKHLVNIVVNGGTQEYVDAILGIRESTDG